MAEADRLRSLQAFFPGSSLADLRSLMPSDIGGMMPEAYADPNVGIAPVIKGAVTNLATLPQRAIQNSQFALGTGTYDPGPTLEASSLAMMGGVGGTGAGGTSLGSGPIRAFHSSPHDFDKFDLSKIGTGEGAQAYGHGLYFAENPAVSGQGGQYWNQFLREFKGNERSAATELSLNKFDRDTSIANVQNQITKTSEALKTGNYPEPARYGPSRDKYEAMLRDYNAQLEMLKSGQPVGPRTYEVNINADPAHFLDWDKPPTQQPRSAMDILYPGVNPAELDVHDIRNVLRNQSTAKDLADAGIPGIKYLDQGSRTAGEGSRNYVLFNDKLIDIVRKYAAAGIALPPAIAAQYKAMQSNPTPE